MYNKEDGVLFDHFKHVYEGLMKGDWAKAVGRYEKFAKVVERYEKLRTQPKKLQFTVLNDSLLHIAVYTKNENMARELLKWCLQNDPQSIRKTNDNDDTILHEAAAKNMVDLATDLIDKAPDLLHATNKNGETPLFQAAHYGKRQMFDLLALAVHLKDGDHLQRHLTRDDHTNILHITILAEFFDLAFVIAKKYPDLLSGKDGAGKIGLQLLSSNPSAFMSGRNYGLLKRFIFNYCIPTSEDMKKEGDGEEDLKDDYYEFESFDCVDPENSKPKGIMLASALTKINICVWKFLRGWPMMKTMYEDYIKHEWAWRLAKLLIRQDTTWAYNLSEDDKGKISVGVYHPEDEGDGEKFGEDEEAAKPEVGGGRPSTLHPLSSMAIKSSFPNPNIELKLLEISSSTPDEIRKIITKEVSKSLPPLILNRLHTHPTSLLTATSTLIAEIVKEILRVQEAPVERVSDASSLPDHPTSLLTATSTGIVEIVNEILRVYPQAVEHVSDAGQNILHVAIKHRQLEIFRLVKKMDLPMSRLVRRIDNNGYTLLHQAGVIRYYTGGTLPGPALQLQEELRWFTRVKDIMPTHYEMHRNNRFQETAEEFFRRNHKELLGEAQNWLKRTSQSCSAVAVLIATVAFAAAYTVPGGSNSDTGVPILLHDPFFLVFTVMDVLSLASSLTSVVMFLSILTSPFELEDFRQSLPRKLNLGFTFLFFSVAVTMLAFAATIVLIVHLTKRWITTLIYSLAFLPVTVFALLQFPLYLALTDTMENTWELIRSFIPWCAPVRSIRKTHKY